MAAALVLLEKLADAAQSVTLHFLAFHITGRSEWTRIGTQAGVLSLFLCPFMANFGSGN